MKRIFRKCSEEEGNGTLLFAFSLVILLFFLGIGMDLGLYYAKQTDLENLCQLMRENRFTYQDSMRYADNPGQTAYDLAAGTMQKNSFAGTVTVYFQEDLQPAEANARHYRIRTELSEDFSFYFLRIFGAHPVLVQAYVDDIENYGEGGNDVIWHPAVTPDSYSGSYTGAAGGACSFVRGDFPPDW